MLSSFFFCNDAATTEIYTLTLHDALPILPPPALRWSPGLLAPGQEGVVLGQEGAGLTNNATVLQSGTNTFNNSLFTCQGSHPALNQSTQCTTRTCEYMIIWGVCVCITECLKCHILHNTCKHPPPSSPLLPCLSPFIPQGLPPVHQHVS